MVVFSGRDVSLGDHQQTAARLRIVGFLPAPLVSALAVDLYRIMTVVIFWVLAISLFLKDFRLTPSVSHLTKLTFSIYLITTNNEVLTIILYLLIITINDYHNNRNNNKLNKELFL